MELLKQAALDLRGVLLLHSRQTSFLPSAITIQEKYSHPNRQNLLSYVVLYTERMVEESCAAFSCVLCQPN